MFTLDTLGIKIFFVYLDFITQAGNVRDVNLDSTVAQRFHKLVALQLAIFGFVSMTNDNFINIALGEFFGFDFMFLGGTEEVIEESDIEFEDFDKLDEAAIGNVELAVEVEGPGIAIAAVFCDLAIIDVASQLGGVLILFVLGLEGADAYAVLLGEDKAVHLDFVFDHCRPVAVVTLQAFVEHESAKRTQLPANGNLELVFPTSFVELGQDHGAHVCRHQMERLLVHRALFPAGLIALPHEREEHAVIGAAVFFEAPFEQADNGALCGTDRAV
ncbi:hypothetical protein HRbin36_02170 [bacterium HR36]|nr:hypothetical protein HRbin36_02170 [bacterium HR36]